MEKVWAFVKKYYEIIGYAVLSLLLLGACFFEAFAWIACFATIAFAALLRNESKIFALVLFMYGFYRIMSHPQIFTIRLELIVTGTLIVMMLGLYIYRVVKREYKLNWKTLVPIALFLVYLVLPFHRCDWRDFFAEVFFLGSMYIVFEERRSMDFRALVRALTTGLLISCLYSAFYWISPLLQAQVRMWWSNNTVRFSGLMYHPNTLNGMIFITICGVLLLYYQKKISLVEMLTEFVLLFVCGYLTISRGFLVTTVTGIGVFSVLYFIKERQKAVLLFTVMVAMMCMVGGLFFNTSRVYFERISEGLEELPHVQSVDLVPLNLEDDFDLKSEEEKRAIWEGETWYDPGRHDLRALYWRDWTASPKSVLFGYGISRPVIGQRSSHNMMMQELWKHGLVGMVMYLAMIIGAINWKKIKNCKIYLAFLIMLVPYLLLTFIEQCPLDFTRIGLMLGAMGLLESVAEKQTPEIEKTAPKQ